MDSDQGTAVRLALLDAVLGQHDAPWLAAVADEAESDPLAGVAAVARAAGWWWPYEKAAIVAERPVELHRDEAGRLDAWRGMPVPAELLGRLGELTPDRMDADAYHPERET
ncbi:hypothetical protein CFP59_02250 [Streptomyces malaysiensis subsp. malaysiensis]|nr:hypothetical protein CFP59_02250 [Streptomyces sp. M56]